MSRWGYSPITHAMLRAVIFKIRCVVATASSSSNRTLKAILTERLGKYVTLFCVTCDSGSKLMFVFRNVISGFSHCARDLLFFPVSGLMIITK
jgi:hypothetical protein